MIEAIKSALSPLIDFLDEHIGVVTLVVGSIAIFTYWKQKRDHRRDAALLILQEIRYAEQKVRNYRTHETYSFAEKLLPTNSWNQNIHLFVKILNETEIDLISKFYSNAVYLDGVISVIADHCTKTVLQPPTPPTALLDDKGSLIQIATANLSQPAKNLIEGISKDIEFIHNTPAVAKLRLLSEKKWYQLS